MWELKLVCCSRQMRVPVWRAHMSGEQLLQQGHMYPAGEQKQYITGDSQEITQPSTSPAQTGLSCEF